MSQMKRVFFTGAGGTGKTALFASVAAALERHGLKVKFFPSVSRSFFASRGLSTEAAGLERPEADRLAFQADLFDWYCQCLEQETDKAAKEGVNILIADRSPFDHIAYMVYNAPNLITAERLNEVIRRAAILVDTGEDCWYFTKLFLLPTLCSWMTKETVSDGMRYAPPGKNLIIQGLIQAAMQRQFIPYEQVGPEASIEMRASFVLSVLGLG